MRDMSACHKMRGLNSKIDNQNISLIVTVPTLVNLYKELLK